MRWPRTVATPADAVARLDTVRIRIANGWAPSPTLLVSGVGTERWTEHPPGAILAMGAFSYCQSFDDLLSVAAVEIGRYCSIAHSCRRLGTIHPADWVSTHPFAYAPDWYRDPDWYGYERDDFAIRPFDNAGQGIRIGNDVWLGESVLVADGVTIGDGAIVAARSIVTRDVPPYALVAGAPAIVRRYRFADDTVRRMLAARWWRHHFSQFAGLPMDHPERFLDGLERRDLPELAVDTVDVLALLS